MIELASSNSIQVGHQYTLRAWGLLAGLDTGVNYIGDAGNPHCRMLECYDESLLKTLSETINNSLVFDGLSLESFRFNSSVILQLNWDSEAIIYTGSTIDYGKEHQEIREYLQGLVAWSCADYWEGDLVQGFYNN